MFIALESRFWVAPSRALASVNFCTVFRIFSTALTALFLSAIERTFKPKDSAVVEVILTSRFKLIRLTVLEFNPSCNNMCSEEAEDKAPSNILRPLNSVVLAILFSSFLIARNYKLTV